MARYQKGQSGNPAGKPKGAKDKRTALRSMLEPHAEELTKIVVDKARDGDMTALKLCFDRLMAKFSDKQQMFIKEYLVDLNATQAAIRAGYSKKTSYSIGQENLTKPEIQEAIQLAMNERSKRTEITADNVLREIAKLGFSNMLDYVTVQDNGMAVVDLSQLNKEQAAAITELTVTTRKEYDKESETSGTIETVKFKLADKGINLERLGKHLKLFTNKKEVELTNPLTIVISDKDAGTL